jgi:hypothetical protein
MRHIDDWLPEKRALKLEMASNWLRVLHNKAALWGVPDGEVTTLAGLRDTASVALTLILSNKRTPPDVRACKSAFKALAAGMRSIKRRYFINPPLTDADFAALGLKVPDRIATRRPVPTIRPEAIAEPTGSGKHTVTAVNPETQSKKRPPLVSGVVFAHRVRLPGEPKLAAEEMPSLSHTSSHHDFRWQEKDHGKIADYAVAYENDREERGPWSNVASVIIA